MTLCEQRLHRTNTDAYLQRILDGGEEDVVSMLLPVEDLLLLGGDEEEEHMDSHNREDDTDMNSSWRQSDPTRWSPEKVLDWIYSLASFVNLDLGTLRGENFQDVSGSELCSMARHEFIARDANHGEVLYHCLSEMLKKEFGISTRDDDRSDCYFSVFDENNNPTQRLPSIYQLLSPPTLARLSSDFETRLPSWPSDDAIFTDLLSYSHQSSGSSSSDGSYLGERHGTDSDSDSAASDPSFMDISKAFQSQMNNDYDGNYNNHGHDSIDDRLLPMIPFDAQNRPGVLPNTFGTCASRSEDVDVTPARPVEKRKGPGRPRKIPLNENSSSDIENNKNNNNSNNSYNGANRTPKKRPKGNKSTHLWEFMRTLLDDPAYSPECIKWESQEQGVFRIVPGKSKVIATLWGARKNNETMTFDKLSRSLRWCRTYGFLSEVPKDGRFPKKLCFRFGDRALEWNRTKCR